MRKNKTYLPALLFLCSIFFNQACAQTNISGKDYLAEEKLVEQSTFLFNNANYTVPLQNFDQLKIASVHFNNTQFSGFDSLLNKYTKVTCFNGNNYATPKSLDDLSDDLKLFNTIIIQLTDADLNNPAILDFINSNQKVKNIIISLFGSSDALIKINFPSVPIVWSQRTSTIANFYNAQVICGGVGINNKLKITLSPFYRVNMGFTTAKIRLQYTVPEAAGINSNNLLPIDNIANEMIQNRAAPGCVVLVVKDGKVILNKAYGYHTYERQIPEKITDIFDLASMTKISATTMETMQLYDQGKLLLDSTLGYYLPQTRKTNKGDIKVRDILLHQAGLIPDISTFELIKPTDYTVDSSALFPTKVNDKYFLRKDYFKEVMWPQMLNSPLKTKGQYVYSDLSMCLMQQIIETISATPENNYVQQQIYNPLGLQTAGFLPLWRFTTKEIVPTEDEQVYRHALLNGYVHDPTAALMGGVAGHAGLFANANDIAILYQMMINRGTYGGSNYIKPETVDLFTSKQSSISRRGLGFDRWDPDTAKHYPSKLASSFTYGHTGFTGTCVWVDPKYNLIYIFLSNRVNPFISTKLLNLSIRPRIQDVIYDAIQKGL